MAPRYTILIADDEPSIPLLVRVTIASEAYLVLEAGDGDEAWEILQTCRPDVAILDIGMPGRDGFALTRAIRADPFLAATRVILLTGRQGPDAMAQGRTVGADHYLTKPFSPLQLLATIAACVGETRESAGWPAAAARLSADSSASSAFTASLTARGLYGFREAGRRIDG
jgi:DNA-binding response OmpR family regulator